MADEKRIDPADDSNVTWAIRAHNGKVEIHYPTPRTRIVMDSENARQIGEGLAQAAYEARYGQKPDLAASSIGELKRLALVKTVEKVADALARQGKNNAQIAQGVVDAVLQEVM